MKAPFTLPGLVPEIRSMADLEAYMAAHPEASDPDHQVRVKLVLSVNCDVCGPVTSWEGHDFGQVTQENPDGTVSLAYGSDSKVLLIDDADAFLRRHWEIVHSGECLVVDTGSRGLLVRRKDERHDD